MARNGDGRSRPGFEAMGAGRRAALLLPLAGLAPGRALAQAPLVLAPSTPGGGLSAFAEAMAAALAAADSGLPLAPRHTAGSAENVALLRAGDADLALVAGETATAALAGEGAPRIVAALYGTALMFAVPGASPYRSIADLRGRPVLWGAATSNFVVAARQVMGALGLDIERDFQPLFVARMDEAPRLLVEGRAEALWGGGAGWPAFAALAAAPGGARFLAPDAAERARITAAQPGLRPMDLPAGSYPGQDAAIASVGVWVYLLARPGLPDDTGYRLARGLDRAREGLSARLPQAAAMTPAGTASAAPGPTSIHPGALRHLREVGAL
ncbi:TAXI family TRAP transporter solute-binding subunit [Paracraurococcus ruber]|nr:TAXI family TRAP transporter solute-binding subunit [Paracraurococcus ruber]